MWRTAYDCIKLTLSIAFQNGVWNEQFFEKSQLFVGDSQKC